MDDLVIIIVVVIVFVFIFVVVEVIVLVVVVILVVIIVFVEFIEVIIIEIFVVIELIEIVVVFKLVITEAVLVVGRCGIIIVVCHSWRDTDTRGHVRRCAWQPSGQRMFFFEQDSGHRSKPSILGIKGLFQPNLSTGVTRFPRHPTPWRPYSQRARQWLRN